MRSHLHLSELAETQHGLVSYRQLRELGFSKGHVARAHEASRLCRVHRGVYAVGHAALSPYGRCFAAVLACGDGALLSHDSAAWLWGLLPVCPASAHVSAGASRHRRGIRVHRLGPIAEGERATVQRIPATSVTRTLLDLARTAPRRRLSSAIDRAHRTAQLDLLAVDESIAMRAGGPGTARLREALMIYREPVADRARSELLFLAAIEKAGLPRPAINTFVAGFELDAYWEAERFAVEIDGWDSHRTRVAFEHDRIRQEKLKLAGIDSIRLAARRIEVEPRAVAESVGRLLARRREELGR